VISTGKALAVSELVSLFQKAHRAGLNPPAGKGKKK
jgi:hypothetical protein